MSDNLSVASSRPDSVTYSRSAASTEASFGGEECEIFRGLAEARPMVAPEIDPLIGKAHSLEESKTVREGGGTRQYGRGLADWNYDNV